MKKLISVLMVAVLLMSLSATAFAAGQGSPDNEAVPPVVENVEVAGEGKTADGAAVTVEKWVAKDTDFEDEKAAVTAALDSKAFEDLKLDVAKISGTTLLGLTVGEEDAAPVTVVLFYDGDGKPVAGMYFYDGEWYVVEVVPVDGEDGAYTLTLKAVDGDGIDAEVEVTVAKK